MNAIDHLGAETRKALTCLGALAYMALSGLPRTDFVVSGEMREDGSLELKVLHPEGTYVFEIPREEREANIRRESA